MVVSYDQIKEKNYSFSAGQYFDVKIEYTDITSEEFAIKIQSHINNLDKLFSESKVVKQKFRSSWRGESMRFNLDILVL